MVESVRRITVLAAVLLFAAFAIAAPSHAYAAEGTTAIEPSTNLQDAGDLAIEAVEDTGANVIGIGSIDVAADADGNTTVTVGADESATASFDAEAGVLGATLHARAGVEASHALGVISVTPEDVLAYLPVAIQSLL